MNLHRNHHFSHFYCLVLQKEKRVVTSIPYCNIVTFQSISVTLKADVQYSKTTQTRLQDRKTITQTQSKIVFI